MTLVCEDEQAWELHRATNMEVMEIAEWWLARARAPASRMEAELRSANEKIKQVEHERKEERKGLELKQQELTAEVDQYKNVIMVMAEEIKNIQEGKKNQIPDENEKVMKETKEQLEKSEKEKDILARKLEEVNKEREEAAENISILTKVVEAVGNNTHTRQTSKDKKRIK